MKKLHWPAVLSALTTLAGAALVLAQSGTVSPRAAAILIALSSVVQAFTKPVPKKPE